VKLLKRIYKFLLGLFYLFKFRILEVTKIKEANVVLFIPYYHTGGAEKVHLDIIKALKNQRCCVIFTHSSATYNFYEDFKKYAEIIELNDIINKKSSFLKAALKKYILRSINNSKTIHSVFGCNTNYFYELLPEIKTNLKRIDLIHALSKKDERESMFAKSSYYIDFRICINTKAKNDLIYIYNYYKIDPKFTDRLIIIENGVVVSKATKVNLDSKQNIKFGFIGRWSKEKRPEVFLEVAKHIKAKFPQVDFVMAGTGMKANLKEINISGVQFLGEITKKNVLEDLYKSLTGIIVPSVYEGFPMVIMESMVFGVVPLSTDVGGISQHIKHLENGMLVLSITHCQLVKDFIKHITFLIENKNELKHMSNSSKAYAVTNFSIEKFNTSYQNLFKIA
jgi:glycosyltransferase involved in cell wall biosynthesis